MEVRGFWWIILEFYDEFLFVMNGLVIGEFI